MSDRRRAFSDEYVNCPLAYVNCCIEIASRDEARLMVNRIMALCLLTRDRGHLEMRQPESLCAGKILRSPAITAHSGKRITLVIMLKILQLFA